MKKLIDSTPHKDNGTLRAFNDYVRELNTIESCIGLIGATVAKDFFRSDNKFLFKASDTSGTSVNVSVFIDGMRSALNTVKDYRKSRQDAPVKKNLVERWSDHVFRVQGWVSDMREHTLLRFHFTPTHGTLESCDEHDAYFAEDHETSDYPVKSGWNSHTVTLPIGLGFFTKVLPFFNHGINPAAGGLVFRNRVAKVEGEAVTMRAPYLEKMGENVDGRIRYQYLVLDIGDVLTKVNGETLDHTLKVREFTAFETYGNADKKYFKQAKKFVCYLGDHIVSHRNRGQDDQSIIAVGDTAKKAYALARRRIAKNLMDQL